MAVTVALRPEKIRLTTTSGTAGQPGEGDVCDRSYFGSFTVYNLES